MIVDPYTTGCYNAELVEKYFYSLLVPVIWTLLSWRAMASRTIYLKTKISKPRLLNIYTESPHLTKIGVMKFRSYELLQRNSYSSPSLSSTLELTHPKSLRVKTETNECSITKTVRLTLCSIVNLV
jgi:hypothetical protein